MVHSFRAVGWARLGWLAGAGGRAFLGGLAGLLLAAGLVWLFFGPLGCQPTADGLTQSFPANPRSSSGPPDKRAFDWPDRSFLGRCVSQKPVLEPRRNAPIWTNLVSLSSQPASPAQPAQPDAHALSPSNFQ